MTTETKRFEILLAEDNVEDAELVCIALKEHRVDCALHVVRDGEKAITLFDSLDADAKNPGLDLLLVDMNLPKRSGEDILKRLRSTKHYAQTPVIVMSGLASGAVEGTATRHAAMVYFKKPSTLNEFMQLGSIVQSVLEKKPDVPHD
jgi:DNA-binding response OmpR family regulator